MRKFFILTVFAIAALLLTSGNPDRIEAVPETGTIQVFLDLDPEDETGLDVNFEGDFDFELEDDESWLSGDLEPGEYEIRVVVPVGYELNSFNCSGDDNEDTDIDDADVTVVVEAGEEVICRVDLNKIVIPTATPTSTPTVAPTQTPVVIIQRVEVTPIPTARPATISPPKTGDAGLAD